MATLWSKPSAPASSSWTQSAAPVYPSPSYATGKILQESGFNILQESGDKILYEYIALLGFIPSANPTAIPWTINSAPPYPATTYNLFNILAQDGGKMLNQSGGKVLFQTVTPLGFSSATPPTATVWH